MNAIRARLRPTGSRAPNLPGSTIARMDQVRGTEIVDVDLPRDPSPNPTSRTVQAEVHPNLMRHYAWPEYPLRVALLPRARLALSGGVISASDELVMESLWDEPHFERDFARRRALEQKTRLPGTGASLITLWGDNYFHWIFNALPRLAVLRASGVAYDYLIVPEKLRPFQSQTLEMLGYGPDRLMPFTGQHVEVERLVWVAPLSPINEPSVYLLDWLRAELRTRRETPHRRLYVSRRGGTRRVVNEPQLFSRLKPLGYEFFLPEEHSFAEQLEIFGQARYAVGPHGSNFVNGVFADQLSVLEFFQPEHVNWGVYSVLCAAGVDHWSLLCDRKRRRLGPRRFSDMRVDWSEVAESIHQMEA